MYIVRYACTLCIFYCVTSEFEVEFFILKFSNKQKHCLKQPKDTQQSLLIGLSNFS